MVGENGDFDFDAAEGKRRSSEDRWFKVLFNDNEEDDDKEDDNKENDDKEDDNKENDDKNKEIKKQIIEKEEWKKELKSS